MKCIITGKDIYNSPAYSDVSCSIEGIVSTVEIGCSALEVSIALIALYAFLASVRLGKGPSAGFYQH